MTYQTISITVRELQNIFEGADLQAAHDRAIAGRDHFKIVEIKNTNLGVNVPVCISSRQGHIVHSSPEIRVETLVPIKLCLYLSEA